MRESQLNHKDTKTQWQSGSIVRFRLDRAGLPLCLCVFVVPAFTYSRGATSSAEPAKTLRPSANVTLPPEPLLEPSLARKPSTLITSPTFKTSFVIPLLANMPGGPPENPHVVTFPLSSLTST